MLVIGLTGPSGAGKGLFSRVMLEKYGVRSIDADAVYHDLLVPPSPCLDALVARFGREILRADGTLDRPALARLVFSPENEEERDARIASLNRITHGYVLREIERLLDAEEGCGARCVILDAPALYESGADARCDVVITVTADAETRVGRITARDGISEEAARLRVRGQRDDAFYASRADAVLRNDGTPEEFSRRVAALYESLVLPRL